MDTASYRKDYSESGLWAKIAKCAKKAGYTLVFNALKLFYAMYLKKASATQIAIIVGALGYFICPIDAVPDMLPGGLLDDGGVIATAVGLLSCCSDPEVVAAARKKASEWFD